ncbi:hypothetical protein EQV77_04490 [Halobacillus fulvus]|nr:hypothetical protein EQV77_04490 [Halobacillus fulvus]
MENETNSRVLSYLYRINVKETDAGLGGEEEVMLIAVGAIVLWLVLVGFAIKSWLNYKQSTKQEKNEKHGKLIRIIGLVPLTAILLMGEIMQGFGWTLEETRPYLFVAALLLIFIPGYIYLFYTVFSKEAREDFEDERKYKTKFMYKHRKIMVPVTIIIPLVIITITVIQLGGLAF